MSAAANVQPRDIDYTTMDLGKRTRLPRGEIRVCPKCRRRGLRLVFAFRRGRYEISYWHTAVHDAPGFAPLCGEACSIRAATLAGLPASERDGP